MFQYRALGTYYPEYSSAAYVGNGFLDVSRGCLYDNQYKDSACQLDYKNSHNSYANIPQQSLEGGKGAHKGSNGLDSSPNSHGVKVEVESKREDYMMHYANGNDSTTRQTVLMWGPSTAPLSRHNSVITPQTMYATERKYCPTNDPLRSLSEMNTTAVTTAGNGNEHKWGVGAIIKSSLGVISESGSGGHGTNGVPTTAPTIHHTIEHHNPSSAAVLENSAIAAAATAKYLQNYHHPSSVSMGMSMGGEQGSASEVWVYPLPPRISESLLVFCFRFMFFKQFILLYSSKLLLKLLQLKNRMLPDFLPLIYNLYICSETMNTHFNFCFSSLVGDTYYPTGTSRTEVLCCPSLR